MGSISLKSIKIRDTTLDETQKLVKLLVENGWTCIGSSRTDRPTVAAVLDEAVARLKPDFENAKK